MATLQMAAMFVVINIAMVNILIEQQSGSTICNPGTLLFFRHHSGSLQIRVHPKSELGCTHITDDPPVQDYTWKNVIKASYWLNVATISVPFFVWEPNAQIISETHKETTK